MLFYIALSGVFGIAFFSDGGNDARCLPFLFLTTFVALSCEMLATAKRLSRGALGSTGFLIFLPWIGLQVLDALLLSPFPYDATLMLGTNLVPLTLFFIAQQRSRSNGAQVRLLAVTLILLFVGLIAGIIYQIQLRGDFSGSLAVKILAGYLSDPAAAGGVAILILFASLALAFRRGSHSRNRLFSLYSGIVALGLILLTRNTAVWMSALAGCIVFSSLQISKKTARSFLVILLACGIAVTPIFSEIPFKVPAEITSTFNAEQMKAGTEATPSKIGLQGIALNIFSENPVTGAGNASFKSEFRKAASPQWQVSPETSNNLYSFVLAENGIAGFLLLFIPAGFIVFRGIRTCLSLPRDHGRSSSRPHNDEAKFHNSNTRSLLAGMLGGITASGVLVALDFSPSFLPVILGVSVFSGIVMHETAPAGFSRIISWTGKRRKVAFITAILLPAALFALFMPASYSAAQCAIGQRALAPFLQNFYGKSEAQSLKFEPAEIEKSLLKAVAVSPDNAEAWISLAQLYTLSAYVSPEYIHAFAKAISHAAHQACLVAPDSAEAQLSKAVAEILLGEKDLARETLKTVERLAPNDLPILFQLAEAYRMLSDDQAPPENILNHLTAIAPNASRVRQMNSVVDLSAQSKNTGSRQSEDSTPDQSLFEF